MLPYVTVWFADFRWISLGTIVLNVALRLTISVEYKHPIPASVLLHPFSVGFVIAIGVNSFIRVKQGKIEWKNRAIDTSALMKGISLGEEQQQR